MAFMAAKCSQCGATIQVDDSTEKGVCPYCGMEYYAEKIINNTYVTNNYSGATINVQGIDVQNYLEIATKFYKQKNYRNFSHPTSGLVRTGFAEAGKTVGIRVPSIFFAGS